MEGEALEELKLVKGELENRIGKNKMERQLSKTSSIHSGVSTSTVSEYRSHKSIQNEHKPPTEKTSLKRRGKKKSKVLL